MTADKNTGPTLEQYIETRLNILTKAVTTMKDELKAEVLALKVATEAAANAADLRYQQRFTAQSDALSAAFAAAKEAVAAARDAQDRAVLKAEVAADKRFESVNEFRKSLTDQQQTFMPRQESLALHASAVEKLAAIEKAMDQMTAERMGIKGGWGYAVGLVGFVMALITIMVMAIKLFSH
jgi:hypothetical protein